jgi:hypothetical protein
MTFESVLVGQRVDSAYFYSRVDHSTQDQLMDVNHLSTYIALRLPDISGKDSFSSTFFFFLGKYRSDSSTNDNFITSWDLKLGSVERVLCLESPLIQEKGKSGRSVNVIQHFSCQLVELS